MMKIKYLLVLLILLSSCSSQYRLWKLEQKDPEILAEHCAEAFPVILPDPVFKEGQKFFLIDTIYAECDSVAKIILIENPGISENDFLELLKSHYLTNQNWSKVDTFLQPYPDSAKVKQLELVNSRLQQDMDKKDIEIAKSSKSSNIFMWVAIAVGVMFLATMLLILKMKKII